MILRFPTGFWWGTATSAHQVEGDNRNNQWSAWEQQPGGIARGERSGRACDWWRNAEADLALAAALGQNAHRLSVEWSRIEPEPGLFDVGAIERYRQILQAMRALGITPLITLHHFTHPQWVEARGGWQDGDMPELLARYAHYTVGALGDLCTHWCTINEPTVVAVQSYAFGEWPPGTRDLTAAIRAIGTMLRAHAAMAAAIRRVGREHQRGIVHNYRIFTAAQPTPQDQAIAALYDRLFNEVIFRAIRDGTIIPPYGFTETVPGLAGSCDFIGINYYTHDAVAFDITQPGVLFGRRIPPVGMPVSDALHNGAPYSALDPAGHAIALKRASTLNIPIYLTEFGLPDAADTNRPDYLHQSLVAVHQAIRAGADVRGVFHWTLVDNFEWSEGWGLRFGLVALDERTGARTPRRSAALYAAFARANAVPARLRGK